MTTDVLERTDATAADEERVFVTLTVADQLCGVPVLAVRDILGEAGDHPYSARARRDRRQPQPARPHRHRDRPARTPASAAGTGRSAAHVGGRRAGRRTLCAAGRSGLRGDEPEGQRIRAQPADAAADLGAVQQRHLPAGRPAAGGAGRRPSCSRSMNQAEVRHMPRTCLVVDDSRVVRKVARRILEAHGFALPRPGTASRRWMPAASRCRIACCSTGTCR